MYIFFFLLSPIYLVELNVAILVYMKTSRTNLQKENIMDAVIQLMKYHLYK